MSILKYLVSLCIGIIVGYYAAATCDQIEQVHYNNQTVVYINFKLPSTQKRLFIVSNGKTVFSTYVTHGAGSGRGVYARTFSNAPNSHATSLGHYRTGNLYQGAHGLSRKLYGLDNTNSNTYSRQIVIHAAPYIGNGRIGTSWGCFAVSQKDLNTVLRYTPSGTLIIAYYK